MIKFEKVEVTGFMPALRGVRNNYNSHAKSDTETKLTLGDDDTVVDNIVDSIKYNMTELYQNAPRNMAKLYNFPLVFGENDENLLMRLAKGEGPHAKFRRMIIVWVDITAPFLWWKEFDTYKIGTTANSESTMHNVLDKPFSIDNFTATDRNIPLWTNIINGLNAIREDYFMAKKTGDKDAMDKHWRTIIEALPSGYMQKRTICFNYEVLRQIYKYRENHKLYEWRRMCDWIERLPCSQFITLKEDEEDED